VVSSSLILVEICVLTTSVSLLSMSASLSVRSSFVVHVNIAVRTIGWQWLDGVAVNGFGGDGFADVGALVSCVNVHNVSADERIHHG
jgi:hypothetical protein